MSHYCEVCGKPEQPPVFEGSAGCVPWVCPNNGKPVVCQVCAKPIAHRVEVLANRAPNCPECHIPMGEATHA